MIKVFQNLGQLKDKSALEFWAKRIVIRCAVNYYEGNKNHFNYVDYDHVMDLQNDDYHFLIDQLDSDNLVRLISELPNSCRMVFNLFVLDGLSHKEIAEFLSISVNTSKSQLFYAKLLLKKALKKEDDREDVKPKLKKYV